MENTRFTGSNIVGISADADLLGLTSGKVTVNGDLSVTGSVSVETLIFAMGYGGISTAIPSQPQKIIFNTYTANGVTASAGVWTVPSTTAFYRVTG